MPTEEPDGLIERILAFSIRNRVVILLATLAVGAIGAVSFGRLPIDAVPDITNVQVQINTPVEALSPPEVERQVTFPLEWAMGGLPGVESMRSLSRYGLSQVTVVFEDGTDIYLARQLVNEKLQGARGHLPPGTAEPEMGPIATGLGEIFMWAVEPDPKAPRPLTDPKELRTIQDWLVRPQFRTVRGINEVNSIGGAAKIIQVAPDPEKLLSQGLSFKDVFRAVSENNANAGGGYIRHHDEQYTIRSVGRVRNIEDVKRIVVSAQKGVPLTISAVADVVEGSNLRTGAATVNGDESVIGTAIMLLGENSRTVSQRSAEKLRDVTRTLPAGSRIRTLYDRTYLVDATLRTVRNNLFEGAVLVIVVLFLMLGNIRAALITATAIPLSMLIAVTGMVRYKMSGNLMSLGAIDFGLIVDGAVIIVENCVRRLAERQHQLGRDLTLEEREVVVRNASLEVRKATMFGEAIIMIVYLPILTLQGIEGKMFQPMAWTVLFALAGAMVLSVTFIPAMCAALLTRRIAEKEIFLLRWARALYTPVVGAAVRHPVFVVLICLTTLVGAGFVATGLGSEFVPKLGEGALAIQISRLPSVSVETSVAMQRKTEKLIRESFPDEVADVFARTGTAEVATDPMGPNVSDTYVMLHPQAQWRRARTQEELATALAKTIGRIPAQNFEISQPIELRFNELISGVRSDVAVKVFGDDLDALLAYAQKVGAVLQKIPGAADVKVEQVTGLPVLTIEVQRDAIGRYGLNVSDVQDVVTVALGGREAGEMFQGDRRFPIVVRLPDRHRRDLDLIRALRVPLPEGFEAEDPMSAPLRATPQPETHARGYVPLSAVATVTLSEGPNQISRENGKRRIVVQANVRGRDIGSFVAEAQAALDKEAGPLPEGSWIGWGGQFENLIAARQRLALVVPVALILIFVLLYISLESVALSLLVFTGVPLALTGGVFALALRGMPLSISASIGFIALSGVAVLNGLVMVSFISQLQAAGLPTETAVTEGSLLRLRPVLMTALVASLGFVPMALATSSGAEVQRPLATVVIGGLMTSTLLTLIVVPAVYRFFGTTVRRTRPIAIPPEIAATRPGPEGGHP
jgi:heavy metal efflux system protein